MELLRGRHPQAGDELIAPHLGVELLLGQVIKQSGGELRGRQDLPLAPVGLAAFIQQQTAIRIRQQQLHGTGFRNANQWMQQVIRIHIEYQKSWILPAGRSGGAQNKAHHRPQR